MIEHYTKGIVLRRVPRGELDGTVTIYTEELGKISAFARSIRKTTSKLSGHMVPGNIIKTRIIEKNQTQAIDALSDKAACDPEDLVKFLEFLDQVIPYGEPNVSLWHVIEGVIENCRLDAETYGYILGVLGFGPDAASCGGCNSGEIAYFSLPDIMFLCTQCSKKLNLGADELILIKKE